MNQRRNRSLGLMLIALLPIACTKDAPLRVGIEPPVAATAGAGGARAATPQVEETISSRPEPLPIAGTPATAGPAAVGGVATPVCARDKYRTEHDTLTIYTLFDDSISMLLWWGPVTDAFTRFLRDPRSAGINMGLKFFGEECDPAFYSVPDVPIGPLPQNADVIATELANKVPFAQTPTTQAVQGATIMLSQYAAQHPQEKVAILLVTDASSGFGEGDPEDCYSTVAQASQAAAAANAASPSIQTHVLGLGDATGLNMLSQAGGTGDAFSADPADAMAADKVVEAMHQIRKRALPCDYALPAGAEQTPKLVNLEFSLDGATATTVPGVGTERACHPEEGGWYYDNPDAPKRLIACPGTCQAFDDAAEVNVVLGCPTIGPD